MSSSPSLPIAPLLIFATGERLMHAAAPEANRPAREAPPAPPIPPVRRPFCAYIAHETTPACFDPMDSFRRYG
jgi:hypothetical protein